MAERNKPAATGEASAIIIVEKLYDKPADKLTEEEKKNVVFLSQVASGLASTLIANDGTVSAAMGSEIGKRAVENNDFYDVPMGTMTEFEQIELIAKNYFNGDEEKALVFLLAYRKAEGLGIRDGIVDSIY